MHLLFLVVGIVLIVVGAKKKDDGCQRSGGGIGMLSIGMVLTVIGAVIFSLGFINGVIGNGASAESLSLSLKSAPLDSQTSDKIGMTIMLLGEGKDLKTDPEVLRDIVVRSFEKNGYSFSKTVQAIADDPINAQRNGMWTGFILGLTSDLTENQINDVYTKDEASAILDLRKAMKAIGG